MNLLFITNYCPHYRVQTYEVLSRRAGAHFLFYSDGQEVYWDKRHGVQSGGFSHEYLPGFYLGRRMRISPALVQRVWRTRADVIIKCINGRFALPVTYLLARLRRKPFVLWTGIWSHPTTLFHQLSRPVADYIYRHADAIAVYGTHVRDYLVGRGVDPDRIFVAWHALDNSLYDLPVSTEDKLRTRQELGIGDRQVVLYVGRLAPAKGLDVLVDAIAGLAPPRPILMVVGAGPLQPGLEAQAAARGIETRFVGYVANRELFRYYALADVFVLPSTTTRLHKETWGLVINEAMNQAVPVIATTAVGAAAGGLVRHNETGLVVPEGDAPALQDAMQLLLADSDLARRLGNAGKAEVARFDNPRMADGFIAAANHALRRRRGHVIGA